MGHGDVARKAVPDQSQFAPTWRRNHQSDEPRMPTSAALLPPFVQTSDDLDRGVGFLDTPSSEFPPWATSFQTPDETRAIHAIAALRQTIDEFERAIASEQLTIDQSQSIKSLFVGTGDQFKDAVAAALQELGMSVVDGPHPRADLIGTYDGRIVAIEAKGLDGSVREFNLRQAEQWAAEVRRTLSSSPVERESDADLANYERALLELDISLDEGASEIECKPLLIVGTFRKAPLDERNPAADLPHPVTRALNRSTCCSLTGLQLLTMVFEARQSPELRDRLLAKLLSTDGVLDYAVNWSRFLTKVSG